MSSKLYNTYVFLKTQSPYKKYLFKSGIFYIFLDEDAKELHKLLNLKLGYLNSSIVKCGFPINSIGKYIKILTMYGYAVEIVDSSTNSISSYETLLSNTKIHDFIHRISRLSVENLSISQTYDILENLKQEAIDILEGMQNEKKR